MVNANSRLDNLQKGRGKKKKLGHKSYSIKLSPEAKRNVENIAQSFSCVHGNSGSISSLLNKLASNELMVVATPPKWNESEWNESPENNIESEPMSPVEILPSPLSVRKRNFPKITSEASAPKNVVKEESAKEEALGQSMTDKRSDEQSSQDIQSAPIA